MKSLCLVWNKWETMKDTEKGGIWYRNLDFLTSQREMLAWDKTSQENGVMTSRIVSQWWPRERNTSQGTFGTRAAHVSGTAILTRLSTIFLCSMNGPLSSALSDHLPLPVTITTSLQCHISITHLCPQSIYTDHDQTKLAKPSVSDWAMGLPYSCRAWLEGSKHLLIHHHHDLRPPSLLNFEKRIAAFVFKRAIEFILKTKAEIDSKPYKNDLQWKVDTGLEN